MSDYFPVYKPGNDTSHSCSAPVTGGNVVVATATGAAGQNGALPPVAPSSGASAAVVGVALYDAPSGGSTTVSAGGWHELVASGAITSGSRVEAAAAGKVAAHTNGTNDFNSIGTAYSTAADGALVLVKLDK